MSIGVLFLKLRACIFLGAAIFSRWLIDFSLKILLISQEFFVQLKFVCFISYLLYFQ